MKDLAIFGDSYGAIYSHLPDKGVHGWSALLSKELDIDNFAVICSSFKWSLNLFFKHHVNYNKVIFCVTSADRYHFPIDYIDKNTGHKHRREYWCS